MKKMLFNITMFLTVLPAHSQDFVWESHFNHNQMNDVCVAFGNVYAASNLGVLIYNDEQNSAYSFDKTTGLTDISVSSLEFLPEKQLVCVGFENGAINFFNKEHSVTANLLLTYNYSVLGSKKINDFCFSERLNRLFIASDYGLLLFTIEKNEIAGSIQLINGGSSLRVNHLCIVGDTVYAATHNGLYKANIYENLLDINRWQQEMFFAGKDISAIEEFNGYLLVNENNQGYNQDVLYKKKITDTSWQIFFPNTENKKIIVAKNHLILPHNYYIDVFDTTFQAVMQIDSVEDRVFDPASVAFNNGIYWIATKNNGLIKALDDNEGSFIGYNAPWSNTVQNMAVVNNKLWVASGNIDSRWFNQWKSNGVLQYDFSNKNWSGINQYNDTTLTGIYDIVSVKVHPQNDSLVYFGTWGRGLLEFKNGKHTHTFTDTNSVLKNREGLQWVAAYGFDWDNKGNMWITNAFTDSPLVYFNPTLNEWAKFAFNQNNEVTTEMAVAHLVIDSVYQYKWINLPVQGILVVFDDNQTPLFPGDDRYRMIDHSPNTGHIPGYVINDLLYYDNKIWVATDAGLVYFDLTKPVFDNTLNAEYLWLNSLGSPIPILKNEEVTSILFDAEKTLWLGTRNNGIYHLSDDFQTVLHHFNTENSPLTDNDINDIVFNKKYNVYFTATQQGILSFTPNPDFIHNNFEQLTVFPNPANTYVTVSGMSKNAYVTVFDIAGKKIFTGRAQGNNFIWNLQNNNGQKISPGIYLIMGYNHNFQEKRTAKLVVTE